MNKLGKLFGILLLCLVTFSAIGCTKTTTTTVEAGYILEGEYEVDITNLGMPLVLYLKIDAERNFYLSPARDYAVDKGHGTIGNSGETYMFIYSDSTPDTPKSSTFTIVNNNLLFSTALPYGASNLPASKVDEANPDITYYLVAKAILFEEVHGDYAGSHTVSAMGSTVEYNYTIKLGSGCEYRFVSQFEMSGEDYEYIETGSYSVLGTAITLTPAGGSAVTGVINADGSISIAIKASEMGAREDRTLRIATTAAYAGTYYGVVSDTGYDTIATIELDMFGNYTYSGVDSLSGTSTESGTYAVVGNVITLTPTTGSPIIGRLANYVLTATFVVSTTSTNRVEIKSYHEKVQGDFAATTTVEEVEYLAELTLNYDGTYEVTITRVVGGEIILSETGTFTLTRTLFVSLNLIFGEVTRSGVVSTAGDLLLNFVVNEVTYGFNLVKS